ncbi:endonuclease/exonuclease/phosphatase family protein [Segatella salivae]|jgi:AP endonuclease domain protein|uniref:endonuclease/exonuclease/phosphatase family protein n=1 Tax=Segatella salivae TaxID=228604 RepID=UPI00248DD1DC|nr:endonuclease/exonuclease/phosphatase family protein [Segatella salivae]
MMRNLKRFSLQMVAGANLATILVMLLVGYSDRLNPIKHQVLANAGLVFPVFLIINFGFLAFWLCFKKKGALLPLAGYLVCYGPVRTYIPFNIPQSVPDKAIKVMSYNVWSFAGWKRYADGKFPILEYIKEQHPDILCMQEAMTNEIGQHRVDAVLDKLYAYKDTLRYSQTSDCIALYSRYPIVSHERISYPSKGNLSGAFEVKIGNDTVIIVNNHLETTGLSNEDKREFKSLVKGDLKVTAAKQTSYRLVDKLGDASAKRAVQADAVARYISNHSDKSMIVCGDFNDTPISYARHTIAKNLIDCYVSTGNGPGVSYHAGGMYVRIDHIMCTKDWQPYACKVDHSIGESDHYPIVCWLKKRGNG